MLPRCAATLLLRGIKRAWKRAAPARSCRLLPGCLGAALNVCALPGNVNSTVPTVVLTTIVPNITCACLRRACSSFFKRKSGSSPLPWIWGDVSEPSGGNARPRHGCRLCETAVPRRPSAKPSVVTMLSSMLSHSAAFCRRHIRGFSPELELKGWIRWEPQACSAAPSGSRRSCESENVMEVNAFSAQRR